MKSSLQTNRLLNWIQNSSICISERRLAKNRFYLTSAVMTEAEQSEHYPSSQFRGTELRRAPEHPLPQQSPQARRKLSANTHPWVLSLRILVVIIFSRSRSVVEISCVFLTRKFLFWTMHCAAAYILWRHVSVPVLIIIIKKILPNQWVEFWREKYHNHGEI